MGCIISKSSTDPQPNDLINPNHQVLAIADAKRTTDDASKLIVDPTPPEHDDTIIDANTNKHQLSFEVNNSTFERCPSFHTVEEYDQLLQRNEDDDVIQPTIDSTSEKDSHDNTWSTIDANTNDQQSSHEVKESTIERCASFHTIEEHDELLQRITSKDDDDVINHPSTDSHNDKIEFQTVASLRQWLDYPRCIDTDTNTDEDKIYKKTPGDHLVFVANGKQQKEENIIELVVAFDHCIQQLQIEEDNNYKSRKTTLLNNSHNMID